MEGSMSQGGMISGGSHFGGLDLQGSAMRVHHQPMQGSSVCPAIPEGFVLSMGAGQNCDRTDFSKGERGRVSGSEEEEVSLTEEGIDCLNDGNRGKKGLLWQRVKWTDNMVKLLITAVSYIGEDVGGDHGVGGGRRKFAVLQKKGKWKAVSKVMAERGHHVSPQQCEDKFNDLNKRYKKLNDVLGRGTSCQVVENPALLDVIDYLTEREKDDVKKILNSKQLFYEEMCSYHNANRLHLPHDPALQRSLMLALRNKDDHDGDRRVQHDDQDEVDQDMETDDRDEFEDNHPSHTHAMGTYGITGSSGKIPRQGQIMEDFSFRNSLNYQDSNTTSHPHPQAQTDTTKVSPESLRTHSLKKQWIESRMLQLQDERVHIQAEMLELERQRFKWERFSRKRDRELDTLRLENEKMRLENERMALELKRREMGL